MNNVTEWLTCLKYLDIIRRAVKQGPLHNPPGHPNCLWTEINLAILNCSFSTDLDQVTLDNTKLYILEDERTEVVCHKPPGSPEPTITWLREGGKSLPKRFKHQGCCTLLNNRTRINDSGKYTCTAKNIFGTSSSTVEIIVSGKLKLFKAISFP